MGVFSASASYALLSMLLFDSHTVKRILLQKTTVNRGGSTAKRVSGSLAMSIPPPMMPSGEVYRAHSGRLDEQEDTGLDADHFGSPWREQAEEPQAKCLTIMVSMLQGKGRTDRPPGAGFKWRVSRADYAE